MERKRIRLSLLLMLDNLPTMQTTSGEEFAEKEAEKVIYLVILGGLVQKRRARREVKFDWRSMRGNFYSNLL